MRTENAKAPGTEAVRSRGGRPAESLGTQIAAALGYTVVVMAVALAAFSSFTDDFGLGQAAAAGLPVAGAFLAGIKRRARL